MHTPPTSLITRPKPPLEGKTVGLPWEPGQGTQKQSEVEYALILLGATPLGPKEPSSAKAVKGEDVTETTIGIGALLKMADAYALAIYDSRASLLREAHAPTLEKGEGNPQDSRYFGRPWLPEGVDWPTHNGHPMHFIAQINGDTAPRVQGLTTGYLLSVFVGMDWDDKEGCFIGFFDTSKPGRLVESPAPVEGRRITEWQTFQDAPHRESMADFVEIDYDVEEILSEYHNSTTMGKVWSREGKEMSEGKALRTSETLRPMCFMCDKVGGHPFWYQGDERPKDTNGVPMELVLQVGSEEAWPLSPKQTPRDHPLYGNVHVFFSPTTGQWAYAWGS
jgi:Domain of unknown function (DUF1963)